MTDCRAKATKLSNEDANNNEQESKKVLTIGIADLPSCLLGVIMSFLLLKDKIIASTVCKAWHEAVESVRVLEKYLWVISFPECGNLVYLFDPLQRKLYTQKLPGIAGNEVCYSKDSWLLMRRSSLVDLFFFNPYTRELISLPKCELSFWGIAFSSAPTSGTCVLVALKRITKYLVAISICYPGATEWITMEFPCSLPFMSYVPCKLVYANGHFYYFTTGGVLFNFDPASRTLNHQAWDERICPYEWRVDLMEQKGELFLMYTCGKNTPMVYKLVSSKWEKTRLDGLTIFASPYSSETRMDVHGMRNSMYFLKYGLRTMKCVSYSFDEGRYDPPEELLQPKGIWKLHRELCPLESLWIEPPPKDVLDNYVKG